MNSPIRIGIIGCGDISATRHIPTIHAHFGATLAALCDTDKDRAEALASQYKVSFVTDDYKKVLQNEEIDAVVVATPPWVTAKITMDALRSGKHVLCEKPMALDLETADEVMKVEEETGRSVQVGFTYRHGHIMDTLRKWIREGRLGSPLIFRLGIFDEIWAPSENPEHYQRVVSAMEHGSPSIHDGAHIADFLNFFTDSSAVSVDSFGMKSRDEFPCSNYDTSIIRFANGDMAKVEIGWFFPKFPQGEFEILGPKGIAIFDRFEQSATLHVGSVTERTVIDEDWMHYCFKIQLDKFLASIHNNTPFMPGTAEGRKSLELTKRIEASIKESGSKSK
jgi:myo-inositol 2-dehydrogenase/D-chiro-inositol 1-dehydrogenase